MSRTVVGGLGARRAWRAGLWIIAFPDGSPQTSAVVHNFNPAPGTFATTRWSVVRAAGGQSTAGREALEKLCAAYWQPVYAFIRCQSANPVEAADLTQSFFLHLIEDRSVGRANAERGRFRSFLIGAIKHFLADERDRARAQKRGGGIEFIPIDFQLADSRCGIDAAAGDLTPDRAFDRALALALMERALARLREEFVLSGRAALFDALKGFLTGERSPGGYAEAAKMFGGTEGAAKMTATRMRQRFAAIVRQELAQTVGTAQELAEELKAFRDAFDR